jgi:hypothetical protein
MFAPDQLKTAENTSNIAKPESPRALTICPHGDIQALDIFSLGIPPYIQMAAVSPKRY